MLYYAVLVDRLGLTTLQKSGPSIYERDWDVLVVLDACRADLMAAVSDEYEFVDDHSVLSNAGTSEEWMQNNFNAEFASDVRKTAYVSANPFTSHEVQPDQFAHLDEVWRYAWDDDLGTVRPEPVTDRAISYARERVPAPLIVHYMQPHFPALSAPDLSTGVDPDGLDHDWEGSVWKRLRRGEVSEAAVWDAYKQNLRDVLDSVELLLENLDADRVVITADHGNAKGEWGFYGHEAGIPLRVMREVPWCVTTATDEETYEPPSYEIPGGDESVADRLSALGYQ